MAPHLVVLLALAFAYPSTALSWGQRSGRSTLAVASKSQLPSSLPVTTKIQTPLTVLSAPACIRAVNVTDSLSGTLFSAQSDAEGNISLALSFFVKSYGYLEKTIITLKPRARSCVHADMLFIIPSGAAPVNKVYASGAISKTFVTIQVSVVISDATPSFTIMTVPLPDGVGSPVSMTIGLGSKSTTVSFSSSGGIQTPAQVVVGAADECQASLTSTDSHIATTAATGIIASNA